MHIKIKKGFDIHLVGRAEKTISNGKPAFTYALKPSDFLGMYRPKMLVKEGDRVKAGTPLFYDKRLQSVLYTSPVSGEIAQIKRGEKRAVLEVVILADKEVEYEPFEKYSVSELGKLEAAKAKETLLKSGAWVNLIKRPYGIVADPEEKPKAIFISAFDSHPLAPDYEFLYKNEAPYFQAGIDILGKIANVPIHVTFDAKSEVSPLRSVRGVEIHTIAGTHPAGNVGVQIHHIAPINKGETVWTIQPYGVIQMGKLFMEGKYDASKLVALTGSEVAKPAYAKTFVGAKISDLLDKNLKSDHVRVISGNVLTGESVGKDGYLGFYHNQVTVIPEGDKPRFILTDGWLAPTQRTSIHRAFGLLSFLSPKKERVLDSSLNGEPRAFVMSGAFEKVMPMDIYPTYLFKAIMAQNYEEMEALGIYELVEEDVALCEFVDVSKHELQLLLREGLNLLREG
ncbi:Na(+)-translocating NADH-quinone reductase subunit A [Hugenholtzia roseola]|uniref:Na(+)-translocating NADH-quinone reductase subunit A n=1 Tax=Hugenholtzia roseola TaxID=1002 RepID=UPI00041A5B47|nr:Na(+)-translocating NADH-quinone reductase subunit A [Hugenholtzia roseola]